MKVLFVSSGNSHYGIVPFIKNQGESLREKGLILDYFTIKGKGFRGYLSNVAKLRKHIKKNNYDIIHAHYSFTGMVCVLAFSGIPIILSLMGVDAYGKSKINGKRIKSSYFVMFLTQLIQPFVKRIIVKSKNIYDYIYLRNKAFIIPNGVNFEKFIPMDQIKSREKLKLLSNKKLILYLANIKDPRKNYQLFIKACNLLSNGDYEIINPYPVDNSQVPDFFNACDVFVLTSFNEGSPNVIKEAMACNCPIVSTDVGDVREVISKTEGCFITSFDANDVAEKIDKALKFGKRTNGRKNISHLESGIMANKIINIYNSILNV